MQKKTGTFFKFIFFFGGGMGFIGFLILAISAYFIVNSENFPKIDDLNTYIPPETTKIYAQNGEILGELHKEENRILIPIEKISPILQKTVIALEDTDFYKHKGINIRSIMRALYRDILARKFVEGGSTLTQQLARNLFLTKQKKIVRKLSEMILAIQIERKYTKMEILEMYLNEVYWGHNAYGIESASRMYFNKTSTDLTLSESAVLVGMLKGPELFSPFRNYSRCKARQKVVLTRMKKLGLITDEMLTKAYETPLELADRKKFKYKAPFFTTYIVKQLIEQFGEETIYTSGLKVYTTLDYKLQTKAQDVVKKYVEKSQKPHWIKGEKVASLNISQAAILLLEPETGYIKTMQGGVDFKVNEFNRCYQAKRQPGSAFKPFVYLAALKNGFSPGTFIDDAPVTFNTIEGPYSPLNYTLKYNGLLPMRKALEKSINVVAIKLNALVGPKAVVAAAQSVGIDSPLKPVLSLPLGALEVNMLELTKAYSTLANSGRVVEPTGITRIEDRYGNVLYEHRIKDKKVVDSNVIAALVDMMTGVINFGTGKNARLPRPVAGKTGTTTDYKDAWFVGFVPQLVCSVWVGNDDNSPMNNMTGGWYPAMMWREFMKEALQNVPAQRFVKAKNLIKRRIDKNTGYLAMDDTNDDDVNIELFLERLST